MLHAHSPRPGRRRRVVMVVVVLGRRAQTPLAHAQHGLHLHLLVEEHQPGLGVPCLLGLLVRAEVDVGDGLVALVAHLHRDVAEAAELVLQRLAQHHVRDLMIEVGQAQHLVAVVRRAPLHLEPVVVERAPRDSPVGRGVAPASPPVLAGRLVGAATVAPAPVRRPARAVVVARHGPLALGRVSVLLPFHPRARIQKPSITPSDARRWRRRTFAF
uniref:Putative secreted protein n=1 Tax=Ixodes ricinus TaxID=34613 RepID=A0A090XET6_IXORI